MVVLWGGGCGIAEGQEGRQVICRIFKSLIFEHPDSKQTFAHANLVRMV